MDHPGRDAGDCAFEEYARPLILDEVTPVYVNGTPRHIRL